ncbi:hypothetical protein Mp_3g06020 [Marchantia polymorpha subsp. ruderalis]|uniref:Uncharacterized protein n=2 Tax=Marchantia polymorpha TaxID=3197 RepID=A0AAF6AXW3_MARPO|nr:hypothetical protein MARPO_0006s0072 [Marchantia polymorpha]BBN04597.1 hypothetical protein Mp_3g06020 [Marchantia polymorpha subsp. ruderalis]|eukprot:PTQ48033.1 hypothetical protein MARPO_0006s0072 [Marchantia polymorpha]
MVTRFADVESHAAKWPGEAVVLPRSSNAPLPLQSPPLPPASNLGRFPSPAGAWTYVDLAAINIHPLVFPSGVSQSVAPLLQFAIARAL